MKESIILVSALLLTGAVFGADPMSEKQWENQMRTAVTYGDLDRFMGAQPAPQGDEEAARRLNAEINEAPQVNPEDAKLARELQDAANLEEAMRQSQEEFAKRETADLFSHVSYSPLPPQNEGYKIAEEDGKEEEFILRLQAEELMEEERRKKEEEENEAFAIAIAFE